MSYGVKQKPWKVLSREPKKYVLLLSLYFEHLQQGQTEESMWHCVQFNESETRLVYKEKLGDKLGRKNVVLSSGKLIVKSNMARHLWNHQQ